MAEDTRFRVRYRLLADNPQDAHQRALGIALEQTVEIPGDIARGFGAEKIGEVLDAVFVGGGNAATGYAYSLLSPPITAMPSPMSRPMTMDRPR